MQGSGRWTLVRMGRGVPGGASPDGAAPCGHWRKISKWSPPSSPRSETIARGSSRSGKGGAWSKPRGEVGSWHGVHGGEHAHDGGTSDPCRRPLGAQNVKPMVRQVKSRDAGLPTLSLYWCGELASYSAEDSNRCP